MANDVRSYIVTGAAGGIGGATSARLLATGANVLGVDISARRLETAAERFRDLPGRFETFRSSLDSEEAGQAVAAAALEAFGSIHGLANIAGGMVNFRAELMGAPLSTIGLDYFRRTFALNLDTAFIMCKAVEPHMSERGYGKIVNIASLAAFANDHEQGDTAYSTAKWAVIGLSKVLNLAVGPSGIRVNCVAPGLVMTDAVRAVHGEEFYERQRRLTTLGVFPTLENLAETIAFLLEPPSDAISGEVIKVAAGAR